MPTRRIDIKYVFYIGLTVLLPFLFTYERPEDAGDAVVREGRSPMSLSAVTETNDYSKLVIEVDKDSDIASVLLNNPLAKEQVNTFFYALTGDKEVTRAILSNVVKTDVPLFLAFSLSWVESRFDIQAYSKNHTSIDRGLFQLNSRSFPNLTKAEFYDPYINAEYGLEYLDKCIKEEGNVIAGLAMYNAGRTRVETGGTPRKTLDYISRILDYRKTIEANFILYMEHTGIIVKTINNTIHVALSE